MATAAAALAPVAVQTPLEPKDVSDRLLDVLQWGAQVVIAVGSLWAFLIGIAKPASEYLERRKQRSQAQRVAELRQAIAPELRTLNRIATQEDGCIRRMESVIERQEVIFDDLDAVLRIAIDNHDRIDETNDLLNAVGFDAERRIDEEKRLDVEKRIHALIDRRKERKRELEERRAAQELVASAERAQQSGEQGD